MGSSNLFFTGTYDCPSACEVIMKDMGNIEEKEKIINKGSGPRLNIKTVLSTYGDFHVKDKTAVRTSYL